MRRASGGTVSVGLVAVLGFFGWGCGETPAPRESMAGLASGTSVHVNSPGQPLPPRQPVPPEQALPAACPLNWQGCYLSGLEELERGDLEAARVSLRCARLLHPSFVPAAEALERVETSLYDSALHRARQLLAGGRPRAACDILRQAATLTGVPGGPNEAARLLERNGYVKYADDWVHTDEVVSLEKRASRLADLRRQELSLGAEFLLYRNRGVRVFTDVSTGEGLLLTRKLHRLLDSLLCAYRELFLPLGAEPPTVPVEGLDVIVFRSRGDYEKLTGSKTSLGMFLPRYRASAFFLGDRSFEESVPVLLHEACHQLDDRLLGMRYPPPWLQEGLAMYFEGASVSRDGSLVSLGLLSPDQSVRVREALGAPRSSQGAQWWGLERLVGTAKLEGLHGKEAVHDFYAQAASLVTFLLDDRVLTRELFYQLVERARDPASRPESAWRDFEAVLRSHGETTASLEARWRRAAEGY